MRGLTRLQISRVLQPLYSDERGASLTLVALSLVWIVGMASLVIDVSSGWLVRQALIPATDSAALAAAQDLVDQPWDAEGACETAETYIEANAPEATMTGCDVIPFGPDGGRVTITAGDELESLFVDLDDGDRSAQSVSSASWGPPLSVSALRPVGFCYDGSFALRQLIDNPPTAPTWVKVYFLRDDSTACGGLASVGNFATLDFEGGTEIHEIRTWMDDGYPGQVSLDDPPVSSCDDVGATCYERPYASLDLVGELTSLRDSGAYAVFPLFDFVTSSEAHLVGAIRARIYDFEIDGGAEEWFFELKVEPGLVTGTCCGPPGLLSDNKVIAVCGVDPDAFEACYPSTN